MNSQDLIIAVPTMGTMRVELAQWLHQQPYNWFGTNELSPHSLARNTIVETFLNKTNAKYLLMVDSDTIPPDNAIDILLPYTDVSGVVTGITPIKKGNETHWNVYNDQAQPLTLAKPTHVNGCGASCLLICREVLEVIPKPWFKAIEFDNGNYCSEDLYFCDQVHNADYDIYAIPEVKCQHFKTMSI